MARYTYVYVNHTHLYNRSPPPFYLTTAVLNDCYGEVTAYTALAYSYWASFHNMYGCLRHAHWRYQLQLSYKSHRTYLTNHMESISYHIMPLVINSLGGRHTHKQTCIPTFVVKAILRNQARQPVCAWFKNFKTDKHNWSDSIQST